MRIKFIPAQILVAAYDPEKEMVKVKALYHHKPKLFCCGISSAFICEEMKKWKSFLSR